MNVRRTILIIVFFLLLSLPAAGFFAGIGRTDESREDLSELPSFTTEDGAVNADILQDLGSYFEEHIGFRSQMVTLNARIRSALFDTSSNESVVTGTDGWLYYSDSLDDYKGTDLLTERALYDIAHTLSMTQMTLGGEGVEFLFAVAPNKATIYPEHMPWYENGIVTRENNLARLVPYLKEERVNYADLREVLLEEKNSGTLLYHLRDSHWNNIGAALASETLLDALGQEHPDYGELTPAEELFTGDLDEMLYPSSPTPETEYDYSAWDTFAAVGEIESYFDPEIQTVNPSQSGTLVMYRDSFTNALLPFLANAYENAYFSRGVPYRMEMVSETEADAVVIERAERFLPNLAENPPVLESAAAEVDLSAFNVSDAYVSDAEEGADPESGGHDSGGDSEEDSETGIRLDEPQMSGGKVLLKGLVRGPELAAGERIFAELDGETSYEAYPCIFPEDETDEGGSANGFEIVLDESMLSEGEHSMSVFVGDEELRYAGTDIFTWEE